MKAAIKEDKHPIQMPDPPWYIRKRIAMAAAIKAAIGPKKSPAILMRIDRPSNMTPGLNTTGWSIPITAPVP